MRIMKESTTHIEREKERHAMKKIRRPLAFGVTVHLEPSGCTIHALPDLPQPFDNDTRFAGLLRQSEDEHMEVAGDASHVWV